MARPEEKADVSLLHNREDSERANVIREALEKLHLRVTSYEDMIAGGSQLKDRLSLMENSWCIVLIVTKSLLDVP